MTSSFSNPAEDAAAEVGLQAIERDRAERARNRQAPEAGPGAEPQPGASNENEGVHQVTAADVIRQEKCDEKIVLLTPDQDSFVKSAIKGIQTAIENLTTKLDKFLQSIQSYVDAVTTKINEIRTFIRNIACEIAKYMKVIFDKIMEFVMKTINKEMNKVVAALPSSLRYQFADIKDVMTELILCLYAKMTENLCDQVAGVLDDLLKVDDLEKEANERARRNVDGDGNSNGETTYPQVPICSAEDIASRILSGKRTDIDKANTTLLDNIDGYLGDVTNMLAGVSGSIQDVRNVIGDFKGSVTSALNFFNFSVNVFGCELKANRAPTDYYTFCSGGAGQEPAQLPSERSVGDGADSAVPAETKEDVPFVEPTRATRDVDNSTAGAAVEESIDAELERSRQGDRTGLDDALDIQ
jgi:archaellum component FlaC